MHFLLISENEFFHEMKRYGISFIDVMITFVYLLCFSAFLVHVETKYDLTYRNWRVGRLVIINANVKITI